MMPRKSRTTSSLRDRQVGKFGFRGASLTEAGMLMGLIAVLSIGAVAGLGGTVSEAFCKASDAISFARTGLGGDCLETSQIAPDEGEPLEIPGIEGGNFTDVIFPMATAGRQYVLMPLEESLRSVATLSASSATQSILACYAEQGSEDVVCSSGSIVVPQNAGSFGYGLTLPLDIHATWGHDIDIAISGGVIGSWSIAASRPEVPYLMEPEDSMGFADQEYPMGASGWQAPVMSDLKGIFEEELTVTLLNASGNNIDPAKTNLQICLQEVAGGPIDCAGSVYLASTTRFLASDYNAIGFRVSLDTDIRVDHSASFNLKLAVKGNNEIGVVWPVSYMRPAQPYVFEPDGSMGFSDQSYEMNSTGWQAPVMTELAGNYDAGLSVSLQTAGGGNIDPSKTNLEICFQLEEGGTIDCKGSELLASTARYFDQGYHAFGFRVNLTTDTHVEQSGSFSVRLASKGDNTLEVSWPVSYARPAAPMMFEPDSSMGFSDQSYAMDTVGWQEPVMTELKGTFEDALRVTLSTGTGGAVKPSATSPQICFQKVEGGAIDCAGSIYVNTTTRFLTSDFHAFGFRISLSTDTKVEHSGSYQVILALQDEYQTNTYWPVSFDRPAAPLYFEPDPQMVLPGFDYPAGASGWQDPVVVELAGKFDPNLVLVGENQVNFAMTRTTGTFQFCFQQTEGGSFTCSYSMNISSDAKSFSNSVHAFGYRVFLDSNTGSDFEGSFDMRLALTGNTGHDTTWPVVITRPALP